ncbi:hypothetical protein [Rhizobacter sp. LjRoot28]|uniref:hypothetical protein n=1 Tax=Rhizobacter sp. LjRoot28 TaxID=3342309 RepID=UPI003ECFD5B5
MIVMTDCLARCGFVLPPVATDSLAKALDHWKAAQGGPAEALTSARVACWKHLKALNADSVLSTPEVMGTRAVICTLYSEPQDDDFMEETLHWFAAVVNKLGDHQQQFTDAVARASAKRR